MDIVLSPHASERSIQRNVSFEEVTFIVQNGYRLHRTGAIFCQLREIDMPTGISGNHAYRRLVGTSVLLCGKCKRGVITLYRNEQAFREDRKKSKTCKRRGDKVCPCCNS